MKMLPYAFGLTMAFVGSALAQSPSVQAPGTQAPGTQNKPGAAHQGQLQSPSIRQQVQANLEQAGYSDIKIMPESFLVRAKDKSGNTVMMVINPDSVTSITEIDNPNSASSTTGSAAGRNAPANASGGTANSSVPSHPGGTTK